MKINRAPNPLFSTIELDDHDRQVLRLKLEIQELQWAVSCAAYNLDGKHKTPDVERALSDMQKHYNIEEEYAPHVDTLMVYYVQSLESERHVGDCTCVPCTCIKCEAETLLGVNTIEGLGKHAAIRIDEAFGKDNKRTIDEAIHVLDNYDGAFVRPVGEDATKFSAALSGWTVQVSRWKSEAQIASDWLKQYRLEYFPNNSGLLYGDGTPKMIGTTS